MAAAVAVVGRSGRCRAQVEGFLLDAVGEEVGGCVGGVGVGEEGLGDVGFGGFG